MTFDSTAYYRNQRSERLQKGLCGTCGKKPHVAKRTKCEDCAEKNRVGANKYRKKNIGIGICSCCGKNPLIQGRAKCQSCIDQWNKHRANRRSSRKQQGVCTECGEPSYKRYSRCEKHYLENKNSTEKLKAERINKGLCCRCGKVPYVSNHQQCTVCILKAFAHELWRDRGRWKELLELFNKQGGRCSYTGEQLVIGQGASIDHIVARSKGGTDDISNLQWVKRVVNLMKTDQRHQEFILACFSVARPLLEEIMVNTRCHQTALLKE